MLIRSVLSTHHTLEYDTDIKPVITSQYQHDLPNDTLHVAAAKGDVATIMQMIIQDAPATSRLHSREGTLPICWAIQGEHTATVIALAGMDLLSCKYPLAHYLPFSFLSTDYAENNDSLVKMLIQSMKLQLKAFELKYKVPADEQLSVMIQTYLFLIAYEENIETIQYMQIRILTHYRKLESLNGSPKNILYTIAAMKGIFNNNLVYSAIAPRDRDRMTIRMHRILKSIPTLLDAECREELALVLSDDFKYEDEMLEPILIATENIYIRAKTYLRLIQVKLRTLVITSYEDYRLLVGYVDKAIATLANVTFKNNAFGNDFADAADLMLWTYIKRTDVNYFMFDLKKLYQKALQLELDPADTFDTDAKLLMIAALEDVRAELYADAKQSLTRLAEFPTLFSVTEPATITTEIMLYMFNEIMRRTLAVLRKETEVPETLTVHNINNVVDIFLLLAKIMHKNLGEKFNSYIELPFIKFVSCVNTIFPNFAAARVISDFTNLYHLENCFRLPSTSALPQLGVFRRIAETEDSSVQQSNKRKFIAPR